MIFYFTATGNSLYGARQLDDEVRSIPRELARARSGEQLSYEAPVIGIVSPVFYHELPAPVRDFIRNASFACDYFFIVGTYGCRHGGFAELTRRFLEECGKRADYINTIIMVSASFGPSLFIGALSSKAASAQAQGVSAAVAQASGFGVAVWIAAAIAIAGLVVSVFFALRGRVKI